MRGNVMRNWTYVGTASFGADPGVSLSGFSFNEVLAIATVKDFAIYETSTLIDRKLSDSAGIEFHWIPNLGQIQLSQSFKHWMYHNHLMITVLFTPSYVRAYKVREVERADGATLNYNTAAHGQIDVYCR